jgi:hypothetical protein
MQRLDVNDRGEPALLAPGEEFADRAVVGAPRMPVIALVDARQNG